MRGITLPIQRRNLRFQPTGLHLRMQIDIGRLGGATIQAQVQRLARNQLAIQHALRRRVSIKQNMRMVDHQNTVVNGVENLLVR
jgi:hypothetical protein